MDGENDWDLAAVVRGCSNLNGNSSSQDVHEHFNGDFPSQTYDSIPLLPQQSRDHGSAFPSIVTERYYFGLEEVIDRFTSRKIREPVVDPQGTIIPPTSLDKVDGSGSGGIEKDTPVPQSPNPSPIDSLEKCGGLEDEKLPHQLEEVNEVEMLVEKVQLPVEKVEVPVEKVDEWDGWVWRKYGKKMVNDSPHSKSYYKCNHEGEKCPAKKHVQLSHMNESKYIITYREVEKSNISFSNIYNRHKLYCLYKDLCFGGRRRADDLDDVAGAERKAVNRRRERHESFHFLEIALQKRMHIAGLKPLTGARFEFVLDKSPREAASDDDVKSLLIADKRFAENNTKLLEWQLASQSFWDAEDMHRLE
nr:probable WRKY transcription factor 50 [Ipomoea batatas]